MAISIERRFNASRAPVQVADPELNLSSTRLSSFLGSFPYFIVVEQAFA